MSLHETLNEEDAKVLARLLIDITVRKVCPLSDPDAQVRLMSHIAGIVTSAPNRTTDNLARLTRALNDESTAIAREYSETQVADWWDSWVGVMRHTPELKPQTMCIFQGQTGLAENSIKFVFREYSLMATTLAWNNWNASLTEDSAPDFDAQFDNQTCAQSEAIIALYKAGNR